MNEMKRENLFGAASTMQGMTCTRDYYNGGTDEQCSCLLIARVS